MWDFRVIEWEDNKTLPFGADPFQQHVIIPKFMLGIICL